MEQWERQANYRSKVDMNMPFSRSHDERDNVNTLETIIHDHIEGFKYPRSKTV